MQSSKLESYRLDAVGKHEVGEVKAFHYEAGMTSRFWNTDHAKLIEYNLKDVELCVKINQKNSIIEFYQEISRYAGCPLDRTLNSSQVIDIYVLRKAFNHFVLPSKGFADASEFEGATVFEPSKGLLENVVVLDLKSLYPMAMMTINASPETKSSDGGLVAPNGIRFKEEPDGLTRSIIRELLNERDEKKKLRNTFEFGSDMYHLYDMQQNVIKVIMNSYYGVSGYARFRLYDREIGSAVTSVGRAIISHTRNIVEELGYRVVYGDTDSCMIQLPRTDDLEETIESAKEIEEVLNKSYDSFAKDVLHAKKHYFSIKFEKVYRRFFQGGKKKRYAGNLIWKEGQSVDETDMVGFETKRSDSPKLTREVQKQMMEMILYGGDGSFADVKKYLGDIIKKYRAGAYPLDDIGIPGGIGKNLDSYESDDAHVRGAKYANKYLGTTFSKGSKPKRVYIKQVNGTYPKTDVVCFEYGDLLPPEFVVDYELMLEKTLNQPISRIIEPIGWTWTDFDPSRTTLFDFC
jgi:DNA polymerase I